MFSAHMVIEKLIKMVPGKQNKKKIDALLSTLCIYGMI
jgi:hypothetical protein